jgi:tetratricopeptide (TPR) repeat protein
MPSAGVLHVVGGTDRGKRFDLTLPETRIGRGTDQDVVLSDIAVSRRHITINEENGRYRLHDLGSGNGTLVNGQRQATVVLADGDHIELGNTVLRFNQAGLSAAVAPQAPGGPAPPPYAPSSAGMGPPPAAPSPIYSAPQQAVAQQPAPPQQVPSRPLNDAATQAPFVVGAPTQAPFQNPPVLLPSRTMARPLPVGRRLPGGGGPLDTAAKKVLVFGTMALISIGGLAMILSRTVLAKPQIVQSEAEESYKQGIRLFAGGDYEGAKVAFADAARLAPDAQEPSSYARQCDTEIRARSAYHNADRANMSHRYADALKALDGVDEASLLHDQALRLRRELVPKVVADELEEARRLQSTDPAGAQAHVERVLAIDPTNPEARALSSKAKPVKPAPAPVAVAVKEPAARGKSRDIEIPLAKAPRVKEVKEKEPPAESGFGPAAGLAESKGAMPAYRAKDFDGAIKACQLEARTQPPKQSERTLALLNQIRTVKAAADRAAAEEQRSPDEAVKDYNEALQADLKLSRGVHQAFFKQKIGKVELTAAQAAFGAGKFDQAYQAISVAQKYGAGDGGLSKQLEAKANELFAKAQGMQKTNLPQAKVQLRMILKMIPTSSPTYTKAYGLLNNSSGPHRDEDED